MQTVQLGDIQGVHPGVAEIERAWDLAPVELPDPAVVPDFPVQWISEMYPLVVSDRYCVGQITLYRWLAAHMSPETLVKCIEWPSRQVHKRISDVVLVERLVAPALMKITPQQIRDLYRKLNELPEHWTNHYRSHAHLASLVGVKPLKGRGQ